jgi:hypothetical protein
MKLDEFKRRLETMRSAIVARMVELNKIALVDFQRTFTAEEVEEFDNLEKQVAFLDEHLTRLRHLQAIVEAA